MAVPMAAREAAEARAAPRAAARAAATEGAVRPVEMTVMVMVVGQSVMVVAAADWEADSVPEAVALAVEVAMAAQRVVD